MAKTLSLEAQLEALLFVAHEPLPLSRLAELTEAEPVAVQAALRNLKSQLAERGLIITDLDGEYRLVTAPAADGLVRRYLLAEAKIELSRAALETLAIVAYRGPVTRTQLDEIRGVASDTMVRNLLQRGLIREHGPADEPGKPMRYAVSQAFLLHFGLSSLAELPPLEEADAA